MTAPTRQMPVSAERISKFVKTKYDGSTRAAARALGVDHVRLWRAQRGFAVRGPGADLCMRLERVSGKPMRYWMGGDV